jgi:hypothetical protein
MQLGVVARGKLRNRFCVYLSPVALPGYESEQPPRLLPTNPLYLGRPRSLGEQKHNYPAACN